MKNTKLKKNTKNILKDIKNQDLIDEVERRIGSGEWKINTHDEDTDEPIYYRVIDGLSHKKGYLSLSALLSKQDKREEAKELAEFKRDNGREKHWELMNKLVKFKYADLDGGAVELYCRSCNSITDTFFPKNPYIKKNLSNLKECIRLSKVEWAWEGHLLQGHGKSVYDEWNDRESIRDYDKWFKESNQEEIIRKYYEDN